MTCLSFISDPNTAAIVAPLVIAVVLATAAVLIFLFLRRNSGRHCKFPALQRTVDNEPDYDTVDYTRQLKAAELPSVYIDRQQICQAPPVPVPVYTNDALHNGDVNGAPLHNDVRDPDELGHDNPVMSHDEHQFISSTRDVTPCASARGDGVTQSRDSGLSHDDSQQQQTEHAATAVTKQQPDLADVNSLSDTYLTMV